MSREFSRPLLGWSVPLSILVTLFLFGALTGPVELRNISEQLEFLSYTYILIILIASVTFYWRRYRKEGDIFSAYVSTALLELLIAETAALNDTIMSGDMGIIRLNAATATLLYGAALIPIIVMLTGYRRGASNSAKSKHEAFWALLCFTLINIAAQTAVAFYYTAFSHFIVTPILSISPFYYLTSINMVLVSLLAVKSFRFSRGKHGVIFQGILGFSVALLLASVLYLASLGNNAFPAYYSHSALWASIIFPFWAILLEEEHDKRRAVHLERIMRVYRPNIDSSSVPKESMPSYVISEGLSLLHSIFPDFSPFFYESYDGIAWKLLQSAGNESCCKRQIQCDLRAEAMQSDFVELRCADSSGVTDQLRKWLSDHFVAVLSRQRSDVCYLSGICGSKLERFDAIELNFINEFCRLVIVETHFASEIAKQDRMAVRILGLMELTHSILSSREEQPIFDLICRHIIERYVYESATIWKVQENFTFIPVANSFAEIILKGQGQKTGGIRTSQSLLNDACLSGKPQTTREKLEVEGTDGNKELIEFSRYAFPVRVEGNCYAVLDVRSFRSDAFQEDDVMIFEIVSNILSVVLQNLLLFERVVSNQKNAAMSADALAHDIKNLIQPISLNLELLRTSLNNRSVLQEKENMLLENTLLALSATSRFIGNVMMITKKGETSARTAGVHSLKNVVMDAISSVRSSFQEREIEFRVNIDEDAEKVIASDLIGEVFVNLFVNAVKYNNNRKVDIEVSSSALNISGRRVIRATISDNGIGIPPDRIPSLFARFSSDAKGTGLGLSLIKSIMEHSGGSVSVQNRDPADYTRGTSFLLDFQSPHVRTERISQEALTF